jgi:hypothetical protein
MAGKCSAVSKIIRDELQSKVQAKPEQRNAHAS